MDKYLLNLLPRLRAFGKKLNKIEEFVDKTWILFDASGDVITYRFKRDGVLRKTTNGNIKSLLWELEGTDAISITDSGTGRGEMFRHGFVLDGLLIVQKEGTRSIPFIFFNEAVVKDGDVNSYLFDTFVKNEKLKKDESVKGYYFKQPDPDSPLTVGADVFDGQLRVVEEDIIRLNDKTIYIRGGIIVSITYYKNFQTDKGEINVTSSSYMLMRGGISTGDKIKIGNVSDFTGKLKILNEDVVLLVKEGEVEEVQLFTKSAKTVVIVAVVIIALLFIVINYSSRNSISENQPATQVVTPIDDSQEAATVDTTAATVNYQTDPRLYRQEITSNLKKYFAAINERNWQNLSSVLGSNVDYLGRTKSRGEVVQSITSYWGGMSSGYGVAPDLDNLEITTIPNGYQTSFQVIDLAEKSFYKIPFIYISTMTVTLNTIYEVVGVKSVVKKSFAHFQQIFSLSTSVTIEDYGLRNSAEDWTRIFQTFEQEVKNKPSVYEDYLNSVLNVYGSNCYVQTKSGLYSLSDFLSSISKGKVSGYLTVYKVEGDANGKTIEVSTP